MRARWLVIVLTLGLAACGPTSGEEDTDGGSNHGDGGSGQNDAYVEPPNAHITGIVYAPNGRTLSPPLTVSGALVYVSDFPPSAISSTVTCERCTDVPSGAVVTKTDATGAFDLPVWASNYIIVIQKGQFRVVRTVVVGAGQTFQMDAQDTTLPSKNSSDGNDTIPNIALLMGSYDRLEDLLAKIGLATFDASTNGTDFTTPPQFDIYDNGSYDIPTSSPRYKGTALQLLQNLELMKTYHIIFVPCSMENDAVVSNATVKQNLKDYVKAGGKFYVADWSYDYLRQTWDMVHFAGDDGVSLGSANDVSSEFESQGHAVDTDLHDWLEAQQSGWGGGSLSLLENWDWVMNLTDGYVGDGPDGTPMNAKPDVIVEGPHTDSGKWSDPGMTNYPLTIGFPYGCGRVLYTTYHTVGSMGAGHAGLEPQERILVYLIMEIGVCQSGPILE